MKIRRLFKGAYFRALCGLLFFVMALAIIANLPPG